MAARDSNAGSPVNRAHRSCTRLWEPLNKKSFGDPSLIPPGGKHIADTLGVPDVLGTLASFGQGEISALEPSSATSVRGLSCA
jgi:hypothetical protein